MPDEAITYLHDILDAIVKIEKYVLGINYEQFKNNSLVRDAIIRNLEIIGEATKNIPETLKNKYKEIEWTKTAGLRDILIHAYSSVDAEILWDIIKNKIHPLKSSITKIISELK